MNRKNLANSTLSANINTSVTSITVATGEGANFPAVPFYATITPVGVLSTLANSEIVQVTARSTDTLTVTRAQRGTTAQSFVTGSVIANGVYAEDITPAGTMAPFAGINAPEGWLLAYGQTVSRTTYSILWAAMSKTGTVTMTIATPGVVTWTGHGLRTGDQVSFTTTGALPTGVSANTVYYANVIDANTFLISTTQANAYSATYVNTSGTQSGTHTATYAPYGIGDGSTTFTIPDLRGLVAAGKDDMGGTPANLLNLYNSQGIRGYNLGNRGGEQSHTLNATELPVHAHGISGNIMIGSMGSSGYNAGLGTGGGGYNKVGQLNDTGASQATFTDGGGNSAHNVIQPTIIANYIIKF